MTVSRIVGSLFLFVLGQSMATAEMNVHDYKEMINSRDPATVELTRSYIQGLGEGIGWGNAEHAFYCQPDNLALTKENFIDIIDRRIRQLSATVPTSKLDSMWIGVVLAEGLKKTFPCPSRK